MPDYNAYEVELLNAVEVGSRDPMPAVNAYEVELLNAVEVGSRDPMPAVNAYEILPMSPSTPQYHYRMRAWNTFLNDWEFWTSIGEPSINPPSGDPVTNVTIIGILKI